MQKKVADFLKNHPKVSKVYYLGHLEEGDPQYEIFKHQLSSAGAMVSFDIVGGEEVAFPIPRQPQTLQTSSFTR